MKLTEFLVVSLSAVRLAMAQDPAKGAGPGFGGKRGLGGRGGKGFGGPLNSVEGLASVSTGKYSPPKVWEDPTLPRHTIVAPKTIPAGFKTPILVWGNGGCIPIGNMMYPFLAQLASQGVAIISNGAIAKDLATTGFPGNFLQQTQSNHTWTVEALDWAEKAVKQPEWSHLDLTKVAAGGQSCGGLEAVNMTQDARVKTVGIFNSGKMVGGTGAMLPGMSPNMPSGADFKVQSAFFFLGGPSDTAGANGMRGYEALPAGMPGFKADYAPRGHGGTYREANGGIYGVAASHWLKWAFFGDQESANWFKGDQPARDGWADVRKKNLDKLKPL